MKRTNGMFYGGIPTGPDVAAIRRVYQDDKIPPGTLIPYEAIEEIISCRRGSSRFVSVTMQWRKEIERDCGLVIACERNLGFKVLDDAGKLTFAKDKARTGVKAVCRSMAVSRRIDRRGLDEGGQRQLDKLERRLAGIAEAAQIKTKIQLPSLID